MNKWAKKHFWSQPQTMLLLGASGHLSAVIAEARSLLADAESISVTPEGVLLTNINWRRMIWFALRMGTLRDAFWLVDSHRSDSIENFEKGMRKLPWDRILAPGTFVDIRVASFKSRLYHEGRLKDLVAANLLSRGFQVAGRDKAVHHIWCQLREDRCSWYLAFGGGHPLYRRGYKKLTNHRAPLPEHLAASLIQSSTAMAQPTTGYATVVPFAGSGTLGFESVLCQLAAYGFDFGARHAVDEWLCTPMKSLNFFRKSLSVISNNSDLGPVFMVESDGAAFAGLARNCQRFEELFCGEGKCSNLQINLCEGDGLAQVMAEVGGREIFVPLNPPFGLRLDGSSCGGTEDLYSRIGVWLSSRSNRQRVFGFCLCPDQLHSAILQKHLRGYECFESRVNHGGKKLISLNFVART